MKPSVALLGFVLGSAASITFGLVGVVIVFLFLPSETPRVRSELPLLLRSLAVFAALTLVAGLSFYGQLKDASWRRLAIAALLVLLAAVGFAYWPT